MASGLETELYESCETTIVVERDGAKLAEPWRTPCWHSRVTPQISLLVSPTPP
jgi:hypothetical protein